MNTKTKTTGHYDLLSSQAPKMPKSLPGYVKHVISRVPNHMKPDVANSLFPGTCAHMANVDFRYNDNVLHEPAISHGTCMESGGGKGYIDAMNEALVRDIKLRDKESEKKLEEYYDIWSKIQIFAPQLKTKERVTQQDVRKYGPTNMLDMLGENFSQGDLEQLRLSMDKPTDCYSQLKAWESRGYITYSSQTGLYTKTQEYVARHS